MGNKVFSYGIILALVFQAAQGTLEAAGEVALQQGFALGGGFTRGDVLTEEKCENESWPMRVSGN